MLLGYDFCRRIGLVVAVLQSEGPVTLSRVTISSVVLTTRLDANLKMVMNPSIDLDGVAWRPRLI